MGKVAKVEGKRGKGKMTKKRRSVLIKQVLVLGLVVSLVLSMFAPLF